MTLFVPLIFVCAAMATNPNHCEVIKLTQVTASVEACSRLAREAAETFRQAEPFPFPHLAPQKDVPNDIIIRGQCSAEVLYETMVVQAP